MPLSLKTACLQLSPVHGDPRGNMRTADGILASLSAEDGIDVLLLPEMAFSGYCFDDVAHVRTVLESDEGATVEWCKRHAVRLQCTLVCGYPRSVVENDEASRGQHPATTSDGASGDESSEKRYNAVVVVGPDGAVIAHYHKSFLYCIDKTWADEGAGFMWIPIPNAGRGGGGSGNDGGGGEDDGGGGDGGDGGDSGDEGSGDEDEGGNEVLASLGICMDINPREFEAPWRAYELANACLKHGSSVLLFSSAWTNKHPDDDPATVPPVNRNEILTYWLNRLVPLVGSDVHFVCANRVGMEKGITFTGCSCVMSLKEPRLVAAMGPEDVGVMVQTIEVPTRRELATQRKTAERSGRWGVGHHTGHSENDDESSSSLDEDEEASEDVSSRS